MTNQNHFKSSQIVKSFEILWIYSFLSDGAPGVISPDTPQESGTRVPSVNTDLTKEDAGFFSRLFGNFGFKPKD